MSFQVVKLVDSPVVISAGSVVGPAIAASNTTFISGTVEFQPGNNVTLSTNAGGVVIHGAAGGTGGGVAVKGSGTYVGSTGTIEFANSNNITFGLSNNNVMTASVIAGDSNTTGLVPYTGATTDVNLGSRGYTSIYSQNWQTSGVTRSAKEGQVAWDHKNRCLAIDMMGDCRNQVGEEFYIICYNNTASTLTNGKAVYQVGSIRYEYTAGSFGDYPTIDYADATDEDKSHVIGLLTMDIPAGEIGYCTHIGVVNDLNTSSWAAGAVLYLSDSTPGELTSTAPAYPNAATLVGRVIRSHVSAGNILVKIQYDSSFSDLDDVEFAALADQDTVKYYTSVSRWVNTPSAAGAGIQAISGSNSSTFGSTVTFGNTNGLSFYITNGSVVGSYQTGIGVSVTGNTSGTPSYRDSGTIVFAGGNNITLSQDGNSVTISGANVGGAQTGISGIAGSGASTVTVGTVQFANANGLSFGLNGSTMTASHNALTTARASNDAIGLNTAGTNITWTVNSSGISINNPAWITTAAASNHSHGNPTLNLTNLSGTTASNSAGLTLSLSAGNYITTARASNDAIGLNTAGTNITWTVNSSGISISNPAWLTTAANSTHSHGNPTLALTNLTGTTASASNGLTISLSAAAPGAGGGIAAAASNTTYTSGTVYFSGSNITVSSSVNGASQYVQLTAPAVSQLSAQTNITIGTTGSTIGFSVGNYLTTAANSTHSHGNPTLALTNLTGTTASASNGLTISLSAAAPGGGAGATGTVFENYGAVGLVAGAIAQGSVWVIPIQLPYSITATEADLIGYVNNSSSAAGTITVNLALYTCTASTANSVSSTSFSTAYNSTLGGSSLTNVSGTRYRSIPIASWNMTAGNYLLALGMSVATGLTSGTYSLYGRSSLSMQAREFAGGNVLKWGMPGVFSAATNAARASFHVSDIVRTGANCNKQPYIVFMGTN